MPSAGVKSNLKYVFHVICDDIKTNCGLTPRFNGSKVVAPPGGVHCGSNDTTRKARYLLTHFDRFQALIIIFDHVTSAYV